MARPGGDHDERAGRCLVLPIADADERLALDDVDDLIAVVFLRRAAVGARLDRHDGRLALRGLLQDAEELPAVDVSVNDVHGAYAAVAAARIALSAAPGSAAPKIAEPATSTLAPSSASDLARPAFTPPSTETSTGREPRSVLTSRIFRCADGMKDWPPKPGFTDITSTRSISSSTYSRADAGVDGFSATPAFAPSSRICASARCRCGQASRWIVTMSAPAVTNLGT